MKVIRLILIMTVMLSAALSVSAQKKRKNRCVRRESAL